MSVTYPYPRPAVTVDMVVFGIDTKEDFNVLLIKRGRAGTPFYGCWALPGGFVNDGEDLEVAARRELREETHVDTTTDVQQVGAFGTPGRDPRGHVIAVAYTTLVMCHAVTIKADDDAKEAQWWPLNALPHLAFDHADIVAAARIKMGLV